ncbi:high choriolytic enzyme 1-like [Salvelinus namaycush]|uniref:Metalloendopeptidase n=1 Tax=Salvelinus namaycush TaxID=8040 RepID=A0A8U0PJM8_SALNM|nr:high choriolytic enzyme 1-like [Salvelinus namaycush]
MFVLKFTVGLLTLMLVSSAWVEELTENVVEEDTFTELSVGELLTRADRDLTPEADEPTLMGDIAMPSEKNANPCTATGCLWQKYSDGRIWMAYVIANTSVSVRFSSREIAIIQRGLDSFAETTCVRFFQRQNERDYLSIESRSGCYSYVGRQGNTQTVSLARQGCLYHSTVQHELLHALGFNHEQTRNDLDNHIHVYWENIIDDMKYHFHKIANLNQGVKSLLKGGRYAFSKNNRPTMEPIPNNNVSFGEATQMSKNDIDRLNRLYGCCEYCHTEQFTVHGFG